MKSRIGFWCAAAIIALAASARIAAAQAPDTAGSPALPADETVYRYDLSGPRLGVTFAPDGDFLSQFGWHNEHQAAPGPHGPWFLVETVVLVAGVDQNVFIPNGTLIFGIRLPNSFEFGLGPSVTLGSDRAFMQSGLVLAAGHSFRVGGIRVPVNLAFAPGRDGDHRFSLVTGWAIRDKVGYR